jgi:predicted GNAT family acetyltransferase
MTDIAITVRDNPENSRYEVFIEGEFVGFSDYRIDGDRIIFPHVEVDPRHRGHGVAAKLVRYALDAVRNEGSRTVVPMCPYVQTFIRRYPEYRDLVDGPTHRSGETETGAR